METLEEYSIERLPGATGKKPKPLSERLKEFWSYVNKNGQIPPHRPELGPCWLWTKSCFKSGGYGQFNLNGQPRRCHRVAWIIKNGPIPDGVQILHKCDEPRCVRWDHLEDGSPLDNMRDMIAKGRDSHSKGSATPCAKFTDEEIAEIRGLGATNKISASELARVYKTTRGNMCLILLEKTYKGVAAAPEGRIKNILSVLLQSETCRKPQPRDHFSAEAVRIIRAEYKTLGSKLLANKYGTSPSKIREIYRRRSHRYVT